MRSTLSRLVGVVAVMGAAPATMAATTDWTSQSWDAIVVGAGTAGIIVADRLSEAGFRTLLLEQGGKSYGIVGGTERPPWLEGTNLSRVDVPGLCKWHFLLTLCVCHVWFVLLIFADTYSAVFEKTQASSLATLIFNARPSSQAPFRPVQSEETAPSMQVFTSNLPPRTGTTITPPAGTAPTFKVPWRSSCNGSPRLQTIRKMTNSIYKAAMTMCTSGSSMALASPTSRF